MLKVYGYGGSQPSRAVCWACMIKELPFEFVEVDLMKKVGPGGPLSSLNITGQIPVIKDGDFALYEMPAILIYLSEKHGWTDYLPSDLQTRALVHQYLHFHHNKTRWITEQVMGPHVTVAFLDVLYKLGYDDVANMAQDPDKLEKGHKVLNRVCNLIEKGYFRNNSDFLCTDDLSIADIACYQELAQMKYAELFDFSAFPKIHRWLERMTTIPHHDTAHTYNMTLGDIKATNPNTMERFLAANAASNAALKNAGVPVSNF